MRDTHYNVPREKMNRVSAVYRPLENGKIELFRKPEFREPTFGRGIAGLNGTAGDYFKFTQMLLNGGELQRPSPARPDDRRHDVREPHRHGPSKRVGVRGDGYGFGLGGAVLTDPAKAPDALSIGSWSWGGAWGTVFWIDPVEELIPIMLIQISSYSHFNIRPLFSVVASQAVVDSLAGSEAEGDGVRHATSKLRTSGFEDAIGLRGCARCRHLKSDPEILRSSRSVDESSDS